MPKKKGKAALKKKLKAQGKKKDDKKQKTEKTPKPNAQIDATAGLAVNPDDRIKEFVRDIHIHNFGVTPIGGGKPLVTGADVKLIHGHRYGLIGYNGAGKTTLLHALASGNVKEIPKYLRVLHVHQELAGSDLTVMGTVLKSDTERESLMAEEAKLRVQMEEISGVPLPVSPSHKPQSAPDAASPDSEEKAEAKPVEKPAVPAKPAKPISPEQEARDMARFEKLQDRLTEVHDRLKYIEAETAESRASAVLDGLQFTDRMKNMKTSDLSGGWRMRVSLASALFIEPDLLLLDEPTNHLDFPSVIWLSEYLSTCYPEEKTVVIVSHDRRFLDDVCTDIIHLDRLHLFYYTGNYESFLEIRNQSRSHQRKQYDRQQKMIKHNEEFIRRFKANKKWSTQAQSRMKLLAKTDRIQKVLNDMEFRFYFPKPEPLKNPTLFHLDKVDFGYYGEAKKSTYLLRNVNVRLSMGVKVGILGANGSGKSTLVRLIMEELRPIHGTAALANAVQCGYFAQHHLELLDYSATPLEHLKRVFGDASMQQIYAQLGRFNLGNTVAKQRIGTLSGGQKSRVAFALLTWYSPHLIIMDEPTNHLDMPTIDALAIALSDFEGSVILVSHDQYFVETVCDEYWAVGNRGVRIFEDFEKCRNYSFKQCKPIDVIPREFSTERIKTKASINPRMGALNQALRAREEEKEAALNAGKQNEIFHIDPEREIDKGLKKGLTPNQILRHLRGWKPNPLDRLVTDKLGFIVFRDYFSKDFVKVSGADFFERWSKLLQYCTPTAHDRNQVALVDIAHACWRTARGDKKEKAVQSYAFGQIMEAMHRNDIITEEAVRDWMKEKKAKAEKDALADIERWFEHLQEDDSDDESS